MPKRKSDNKDCNVNQKKRKAITLQIKYDIVKMQEAGSTVKQISEKMSFSASTISTILKDKEKYLNLIKGARPMMSTWSRNKEHSILIPTVETLLNVWVSDKTQRLHMNVSQGAICTRALSIFNSLKEAQGDTATDETFLASRGWFDRYKVRSGWHSVKVQGEAASADTEAAKLFPTELAEIIEEEGYMPQLIFNVDETGLFWKRMPNRSFIAKEESALKLLKTD